MADEIKNVNEVDFVQDEKSGQELKVIDLGEFDIQGVYHPEYHYYIKYLKSQNNKVIALIGLPHEVEYIEHNPEITGIAEVKLTENQYDIIKVSINSKDLMVFFNEENGELFYRRLFVKIIKGEYNPKYNAITSDDNIIRIQFFALDSNENPDDDIKEIHLKRLRSGGDIAPVSTIKWSTVKTDSDGNETLTSIDGRKVTIDNQGIIEFNLADAEENLRTIIRAKAYIPNVADWWLSIYLDLKKI